MQGHIGKDTMILGRTTVVGRKTIESVVKSLCLDIVLKLTSLLLLGIKTKREEKLKLVSTNSVLKQSLIRSLNSEAGSSLTLQN